MNGSAGYPFVYYARINRGRYITSELICRTSLHFLFPPSPLSLSLNIDRASIEKRGKKYIAYILDNPRNQFEPAAILALIRGTIVNRTLGYNETQKRRESERRGNEISSTRGGRALKDYPELGQRASYVVKQEAKEV